MVRVFSVVLRIFVGLVFIASALAKLYPVEPFELVFIDLGVANWLLAPLVARAVIALELFLGLCIVFKQGRFFVYFLAQGVLAVFTVYLFFLLFTQGNEVDCGCFGVWLSLSPVASIVKNVSLIIVLYFLKKEPSHYGLHWLLPLLFLISSFAVTFLLKKVASHNVQAQELNEVVDFSALPPLFDSKQKVDFTAGSKLVVFFSVNCSHCKNLAYKLAFLTKKNPNNVVLVMASLEKQKLISFLDDTGLQLPFIWMDNEKFFNYSGGRLPAVLYLEKGILTKRWTGEFLKMEEIEALMTY